MNTLFHFYTPRFSPKLGGNNTSPLSAGLETRLPISGAKPACRINIISQSTGTRKEKAKKHCGLLPATIQLHRKKNCLKNFFI
jgi:hypothetical protein